MYSDFLDDFHDKTGHTGNTDQSPTSPVEYFLDVHKETVMLNI
jgi:hypothetical protein